MLQFSLDQNRYSRPLTVFRCVKTCKWLLKNFNKVAGPTQIEVEIAEICVDVVSQPVKIKIIVGLSAIHYKIKLLVWNRIKPSSLSILINT